MRAIFALQSTLVLSIIVTPFSCKNSTHLVLSANASSFWKNSTGRLGRYLTFDIPRNPINKQIHKQNRQQWETDEHIHMSADAGVDKYNEIEKNVENVNNSI